MTKKYKKIPVFKTEAEEIKFWDTHDLTDYIDWSKAIKNPKFPNLKYSSKTISIRFSGIMLDKIRFFANEDDMPYQSLIKYIVGEYIRNREAVPSSVHNYTVNEGGDSIAKINLSKKISAYTADNTQQNTIKI